MSLVKLSLCSLLILYSFAHSQELVINEAMSNNSATLFDSENDSPDWLELYNASDSAYQLHGYSISDDLSTPQKWLFPDVQIPPHEYLLIFASGKNCLLKIAVDSLNIPVYEFHTNFRISSAGETLYLFAPDALLLDSLSIPALETDQSFGHWPPKNSQIIFNHATPGLVNTATTGRLSLADPGFLQNSGFYTQAFQLGIMHPEKSATLRITKDGSPPTLSSDSLDASIAIDKTTVIRARAFLDDSIASKIITHTFFIGEETQLPVISLSTDRENFFGWWKGIYIKGPNAEEVVPYYGANFWQDWERPVHIAFFEDDRELAFSLDAGVKIFGNFTRSFDLKSLAVFARRQYGAGSIKYPIFPDKEITAFESILLRNAGNDFKKAYFRDALIHELMKNTEVNRQAYRPAVVFLNGEYRGIHNIREKINEHYLAANYGVHPDSVDLLTNNHEIMQGSDQDYVDLLNYIKYKNMADPVHYAYVAQRMDIENYARYNAVEIYAANSDWPMTNVKYWRLQNQGKWQWLLFDLDSGFGSYSTSHYSANTLRSAIIANSLFPWSTELFKNLIKNQTFNHVLLNQIADYLNSIFLPERVTNKILSLKAGIESEIGRHKYRWYSSARDWYGQINKMIEFAENRPYYVRQQFRDQFGISGDFEITIEHDFPNRGQIKLNSLHLYEFPWQGVYFNDIPIGVTANPEPGFRFAGWGNASVQDSAFVEIKTNKDIVLRPIFESLNLKIADVYFNEIHFTDEAPFESGDWVELYNATDSTLSLSQWRFSDSKDANIFQFADSVSIPAKGYLVLANDQSAFRNVYGPGFHVVGNFEFGLAATGEKIRLIHPSGILVDSLTFGRGNPWPESGERQHFTFELNTNSGDNSLPENWHISGWQLGSPGAANSLKSAPVQPVVISEINFKNSDSINVKDWIELYNPLDTTVLLHNWKIQLENKTDYFALPSQVKIEPDNYLVLCQDTISFARQFPWVGKRLGDLPFALNDSSGLILLWDANGQHIDSIRYSLADHASFSGMTLELKNESEHNMEKKEWHLSTIWGGTPSLPNSVSNFSVPDILINELHIADSDSLPAGQWIELINISDTTVALRGWSLQNTEFSARFFFPVTEKIDAGDFLVIAANPLTFSAVHNNVKTGDSGFSFQLQNNHDNLILRNRHSAPVNTVVYENGGNWPVWVPGHSLELKPDSLDNSRGNSWQNSFIPGGTPGRTNSSLTTNLSDNTINKLPAAFKLYQNFPNPFMASTAIRFDLPEKSHVKIQVFNIRGQLIDTAINSAWPGGEHRFLWSPPGNLSGISGVYILRIQADGQQQNNFASLKMLFLK
ncbi:MAG: T9SS C-terminal target domain-containing protein [Calditrichaeota bacterium]|nr:MAG: T9SS C-terminal target domain-containing protein [Calditrichota bacterium]